MFQKIKIGIESKDPNIAFVSLSILCCLVITLLKFIIGIYLSSKWLIINSLYFAVIGNVRYYVLNKYIIAKTIKNNQKRYAYGFNVHHFSGGLLIAIAATYMLCCLRMLFVGDILIVGQGFVMWIIVFTVFKFLLAIRGLVITRKRESPILRTMKVVGSVDAFISVVPMLYMVLSLLEKDYAVTLSSTIGIAISLGVFISGVIMFSREYDFVSVEHLL